MKFVLLFISIILINCSGKLTKKSCDFDFFEKTTNIEFPKNVEILNCGDNLEGDIWIHLKFSKKDTNEFIKNLNFHSYSDKVKYLEVDTVKILPIYPDNDLIDVFKTFMAENYVEIPKTKSTCIISKAIGKRYFTYIINKSSGLFWGHISYSDWSGDF